MVNDPQFHVVGTKECLQHLGVSSWGDFLVSSVEGLDCSLRDLDALLAFSLFHIVRLVHGDDSLELRLGVQVIIHSFRRAMIKIIRLRLASLWNV